MNNKTAKKLSSLKTTLSFTFFSLCVVILLMSTISQLFINLNIEQQSVINKQKAIAQEASQKVSQFIQEKINALEQTEMITSLTSNYDIVPILNKLLVLQKGFIHIVLLDSDGRQIAAASRKSSIELNEFIKESVTGDLFVHLKTEKRWISDILIDSFSSEPMIIISGANVNIFDGKIERILVCKASLKFMWELMAEVRVGQKGQVYVVDKKGNLIAYKDSSRVLKRENLSKIKPVNDFINTEDYPLTIKGITYKGLLNSLVLGTYYPLRIPDWAIITELPFQEAYAGIIQSIILSIAIMIIMTFLAGMTGLLLARRLTLPLNNVTEMIEAIHISENYSLKTGEYFENIVVNTKEVLNSIIEMKSAMNELSVGGNDIVESLSNMKKNTADVNLASIEIKEKMSSITASVKNVVTISVHSKNSVEKTTDNLKNVSISSQTLLKSGNELKENINSLNSLIHNFKTI